MNTANNVVSLPVINEQFLDEQLGRIQANQLEECRSSGCTHRCDEGRMCPQRIEYAGSEPYSAVSLAIATATVGALCLLVWNLSPELRGLVSIIGN